jgi:hypothetical protein
MHAVRSQQADANMNAQRPIKQRSLMLKFATDEDVYYISAVLFLL